MDAPKTLLDAVAHFADYQNCHNFMVPLRWPDGVRCPTCGSDRVSWLSTVNRWKCAVKHPCRQFSLKTGTIFEDSPLPLAKWLPAVWLIVNAKNGISSYEIHRAIGVTQKTAWFMGHRIRAALHAGTDWDRFRRAIVGVVGKRITYRKLTGQDHQPAPAVP